MITDNEKWYYLAVEKLSELLKEITSKYTRDELKAHEKVCKNNDYCYIEIPERPFAEKNL